MNCAEFPASILVWQHPVYVQGSQVSFHGYAMFQLHLIMLEFRSLPIFHFKFIFKD